MLIINSSVPYNSQLSMGTWVIQLPLLCNDPTHTGEGIAYL